MRAAIVALLLNAALISNASATQGYCPAFLAKQGAPEPSFRGEFTFSPYTLHWSNSSEHKDVVMFALDEQLPGGRLCGISLFTNSFGQPSTIVYAGQRFDNLLGQPNVFLKLTAGVMYGYVGKYKDKVPLNRGGFSPIVIPSFGYQLNPNDSVQLKLLGTAGVMFSYGRRF